MNFFRHRWRPVAASSVLALLVTAAGCSSADDGADLAVPTPDAKTAKICRALRDELPRKLDGRGRNDPEPRSAYTAGWGSPAIILRCGISRPPKMIDPKVAHGDDPSAVGGAVNGVDWLLEKQDDGTWHLTTANREAYVQLVLPEQLAGQDHSAAVLTGMAAAVKKAVPVGTASMT